MALARFGLPNPFSVAALYVTPVGAEVTTVGGASVVKDKTLPNEVPTLFAAMAQKKYVLPGERPAIACGPLILWFYSLFAGRFAAHIGGDFVIILFRVKLDSFALAGGCLRAAAL